jgi:hypothetical protein
MNQETQKEDSMSIDASAVKAKPYTLVTPG